MALVAGCSPAPKRPDAPAAGLNLVIVTLDTTRADYVTCLGGPEGVTPQIDSLAQKGTLFENAYSVANVTKPTHLSILTGQRLSEHGVFGNGIRIPSDLATLPKALTELGYDTASFVSMLDLGSAPDWPGIHDIDAPEITRTADEVLKEALSWLDQRGPDKDPFFLWVHMYDPHTPYDPPPIKAAQFYRGNPRRPDHPLLLDHPFLKNKEHPGLRASLEGIRDPEYPRAMYAAEVRHADQQVGRLVSQLDRRGLLPTTVFVVVADHGESLDEHDILYAHLGLYEVSLRIPMLIVAPGFPAGVRVSERVTQLDLAETLAALFGVELQGTAGRSLLACLRGEPMPSLDERELVFEASNGLQVAVRRDRWKLIWPLRPNPSLPSEPELFDLEADPGETRDVAAEHPDVFAELALLIEPWIEQGKVVPNDLETLPDSVLEELKNLGYTGD